MRRNFAKRKTYQFVKRRTLLKKTHTSSRKWIKTRADFRKEVLRKAVSEVLLENRKIPIPTEKLVREIQKRFPTTPGNIWIALKSLRGRKVAVLTRNGWMLHESMFPKSTR